jgi:hypothetical protein
MQRAQMGLSAIAGGTTTVQPPIPGQVNEAEAAGVAPV